MIKKIDLTAKHVFGYLNWFSVKGEKAAVQVLEQKINEMIEAINRFENKKDVK